MASFIDWLGTTLNLPEVGLSELFAGGQKTQNTGRVGFDSGTARILDNVSGGRTSGAGEAAYFNAINPSGTRNQPVSTITGQSLADSIYNPGEAGVLGASTGGGTLGGGSYIDPAALAYYDDQIALANSALGRIGTQRDIGYGNIESAYQSALNTLLGRNAQAERDAGLTRQRAIDDNVRARADVDANVARQSNSLRRILGNNSSAAQYAAPLAVARQGNTQQGAIQTGFGRNLQNLDIADEDRKRAFEEGRTDIGRQRDTSRSALEAGLLQNEASLNETLGSLNLQKAQARGQNYAQARGALTPFNDRVSSILSQIDQLGRNPQITAREVNYTAPNLEQYTTSPIQASLGQNPAQAAAGQYSYLLGDERRRRSMF